MIEGFLDPSSPNWPRPRLWASVILRALPGLTSDRWFDVDFVIDTGASTTALHPVDALAAGIPESALRQPELWPERKDHGGIGGGATYYPLTAAYAFHQYDGNLTVIEGEIEIAQVTPANRQIPSLLGWDVLQHFKLRLDWPTRVITLE